MEYDIFEMDNAHKIEETIFFATVFSHENHDEYN